MFRPAVTVSTTAIEQVKFARLDDEIDELNLDEKSWDDYVDKRLGSGYERSRFTWWLLSTERLLNLAQPSKVIDRIRTTDYNSPEATKRLGYYFERFGLAARARLCSVPLGHFGEQDYYFYPQCHMLHLLEQKAVVSSGWNREAKDDHGLGLADPSYFCIGRCSVKDGHERRNPGTNFSFISNDDDDSFGQGRKVSGASDSSTGSSKASDGSTDSGYSSILAAIAVPTNYDKTSLSFKRRPCTNLGTHLQTKPLRHPFLYLGDLGRSERRQGGQDAATDYVLAVSLYDLSVWMIYDAWDYGDDTYCIDSDDEDGNEEEEDGEVRHSSFRPDVNPSWARVPGVKGNTLMARIAESVHSWPFEGAAELRLSQAWIANDVVPVFLRACVSQEGKVVHPEHQGSVHSIS